MMFFDGEKNTIKQQIQAEFQKNSSQKPPKPTRGVKSNVEEDDFDEKKYVVVVYVPSSLILILISCLVKTKMHMKRTKALICQK